MLANISQEEVIELIKADDYLRNYKLAFLDKQIQLKPRKLLRSLNLRIDISVAKLKDNNFKYIIKVGPKLKTVIVDNGESLKIVRRLEKIIKTLPNKK